jgi:hypothetical protein
VTAGNGDFAGWLSYAAANARTTRAAVMHPYDRRLILATAAAAIDDALDDFSVKCEQARALADLDPAFKCQRGGKVTGISASGLGILLRRAAAGRYTRTAALSIAAPVKLSCETRTRRVRPQGRPRSGHARRACSSRAGSSGDPPDGEPGRTPALTARTGAA